MNKIEWTKYIKSDLKLEDDVILIECQNDIVEVDELLSKIGLEVFTTDESRNGWKTEDKDVNKCFMVREDDGWRIQSHYLGFGTPVSILKKKIESHSEKNPQNKGKSEVIKHLRNLMKEMKEKNEEFVNEQDDVFKSQVANFQKQIDEIIDRL